MIRRPPRSTRTDTLCPYTTLFRSLEVIVLTKADRGLFALPLEIGVREFDFVAGEIGFELIGERPWYGALDAKTPATKLVAESRLLGGDAIIRVGDGKRVV